MKIDNHRNLPAVLKSKFKFVNNFSKVAECYQCYIDVRKNENAVKFPQLLFRIVIAVIAKHVLRTEKEV